MNKKERWGSRMASELSRFYYIYFFNVFPINRHEHLSFTKNKINSLSLFCEILKLSVLLIDLNLNEVCVCVCGLRAKGVAAPKG